MNWIRDFGRRHLAPVPRNVDDDAPEAMGNEFVDFFFDLSGRSVRGEDLARVEPVTIHNVTGLMLGAGIAGQPYGGYEVRVARDIRRADWPRVYDWISRFWTIFEPAGFGHDFRLGVNAILAANGVVWDLDEAGHLVRILPAPPVFDYVDPSFQDYLRNGVTGISQ